MDHVDYDKRSAAHIAATNGNVACLTLLVEAGACELGPPWENAVGTAHQSNRCCYRVGSHDVDQEFR